MQELDMARLRIVQAQINLHVGNIDGNLAKHLEVHRKAAAENADIVVFPEMSLLGYPGKDLCTDPDVLIKLEGALAELLEQTKDGPAMVVGMPMRLPNSEKVTNSALFIHGGKVLARVDKQNRPSYGVFNEKRLFAQGQPASPVMFKGVKVGVMVCEDGWFEDTKSSWSEDYRDVAGGLKAKGAQLILWPNASPFALDKQQHRLENVVTRRARETGVAHFYTNQVGGQDELVFDGASMVVDGAGKCILRQPAFVEDIGIVDWDNDTVSTSALNSDWPQSRAQQAYEATVLAIRDYVKKQGFKSVIVGLSGGIDSTLTVAMAVDALGPDAVHCVRLPSRYTADISNDDAAALVKNLGIPDKNFLTIPIEDAFNASRDAIEKAAGIAGLKPLSAGLADENLQARERGKMLMYLSNEYGHLLLSTGNKSELSVGYSTLYGDMCGGFAVLKDLYKTMVFDCARWRNVGHTPWFLGPEGAVIPERVITRPPTAELRNGQTDAASLGEYDHLDFVLEQINEERQPLSVVIDRFFENFKGAEHGGLQVPTRDDAAKYATRVHRMLNVNEYKRNQYAPGPRVTRYGLGAGDRDYPITDGSKHWRYG